MQPSQQTRSSLSVSAICKSFNIAKLRGAAVKDLLPVRVLLKAQCLRVGTGFWKIDLLYPDVCCPNRGICIYGALLQKQPIRMSRAQRPPHKHKDPANDGFGNPPCVGFFYQHKGSLCLCGLRAAKNSRDGTGLR